VEAAWAVKTEVGKFGDLLEKVNKKLQEAQNVIEDASRKTRTIDRKLRNVEEISPEETAELLALLLRRPTMMLFSHEKGDN